MNSDTRFLTSREIKRRYAISDMTLWRWCHSIALGFPKPMCIGRRKFWNEAELVAWERDRAAARAVPDAQERAS